MRLFYRIAYWIGFTPWERMNSLPIYGQLTTLFAREESEREQPFGRALDLGCGTGFSAVNLAKRGWQVTGIDVVANALSTARQRAREAGADVRFVHGDITALRAAGVGSDFEFFLDLGAVHGLDDAERRAVGREVTAVATPGATLLMAAWAPGRRGPFPRGASRQDIVAAFPDWAVIAEEAVDMTGATGPSNGPTLASIGYVTTQSAWPPWTRGSSTPSFSRAAGTRPVSCAASAKSLPRRVEEEDRQDSSAEHRYARVSHGSNSSCPSNAPGAAR